MSLPITYTNIIAVWPKCITQHFSIAAVRNHHKRDDWKQIFSSEFYSIEIKAGLTWLKAIIALLWWSRSIIALLRWSRRSLFAYLFQPPEAVQLPPGSVLQLESQQSYISDHSSTVMFPSDTSGESSPSFKNSFD